MINVQIKDNIIVVKMVLLMKMNVNGYNQGLVYNIKDNVKIVLVH